MATNSENKKNNRKVIYDNDAMLPPYCMTTNQIKLEKRFHNGTVLVYQTFCVLSMALMMAARFSILSTLLMDNQTVHSYQRRITPGMQYGKQSNH
jgi:hypothetical protein